MRLRVLSMLVAFVVAAFAGMARAHESRPALLELRQKSIDSYDVLWKVPALGEMRLALYTRFPADCSGLGDSTSFRSTDAFIERAALQRTGGLDGQTISIDGLAATQTDVIVRIVRLDERVQTVRLSPAMTSFVVAPVPSLWQASLSYLRVGIEHIALGVDHLLFVLGLLLIVRGRRQLLATVTSFTLAHSLTLGIATLGIANVPMPPLNAAIALSILFLGPEIVRVWRGEASFTIRHPWVVAFAFGLLHGFGFASGLASIGLPRGELALGLLGFNLGVEVGQLAFVAVVLAMLRAFRVLEMRWPMWLARAPGYAVGVCGAFWTLQRTALLFASS